MWIRWVKAGLVAQAVMWRPSCVAYRHGWAQLGVVLVVHLERGTVSATAAVERRFSLLAHAHLARGVGSRGAGSRGVGRRGARRGGP